MNSKLLRLFILPLFIILNSCENTTELEMTTTVSFKISRSGNENNSRSIIFKTKQPTELKIICIDATKYSDSLTLVNELFDSMVETVQLYPELSGIFNQDSVIKQSYDFWNLFLKKKISGDFNKDFEVSVDLNSENSKEVFVHPGLNLFLFFSMEDNITSEYACSFANIIENENNIIEIKLKSAETDYFLTFKVDGLDYNLSGNNAFFNPAKDIFYIRGHDSSLQLLLKITNIDGSGMYVLDDYFDTTKSYALWRKGDSESLQYCTSDSSYQGEVIIKEMNNSFVTGSFSFKGGRVDSLRQKRINPNLFIGPVPEVIITDGIFRTKID